MRPTFVTCAKSNVVHAHLRNFANPTLSLKSSEQFDEYTRHPGLLHVVPAPVKASIYFKAVLVDVLGRRWQQQHEQPQQHQHKPTTQTNNSNLPVMPTPTPVKIYTLKKENTEKKTQRNKSHQPSPSSKKDEVYSRKSQKKEIAKTPTHTIILQTKTRNKEKRQRRNQQTQFRNGTHTSNLARVVASSNSLYLRQSNLAEHSCATAIHAKFSTSPAAV